MPADNEINTKQTFSKSLIKNEEHHIVSFGGGVNSTAMIILMDQENIPIDEIIFCDPGNEMPTTYQFLPIFEKWCSDHKLKFTIIKSKLGNLRDYYYSKNVIPSRMFRHCTDKFKKRPIYKYLKEKYGKNAEISMYLGIAKDESHRAKESGDDKIVNFYPLVDYKIDRKTCKRIIKYANLPVPSKSGCYFCPFQPKKKWVSLYMKYPELFKASIDFEKNCKNYPEFYLAFKPLEDIEKSLINQTTLDQFVDNIGVEKCVFCHS